ncbi:MAG: tRNA pseudouridine(38-40) synthase TruA [Gemmatimonadota bacterium]
MSDPAAVRFRATLHYDGTAFHGWQLQPDRRTVQGELEARLARLFDRPARAHGAGRTDTGVHAVGQEIAFESPPGWSADELRRALNATLPDDVWVEKLSPAGEGFHPRFSATGRRYEYVVSVGEDAASPVRRGRMWAHGAVSDPEALGRAAALAVGERHFEVFAKAGQPERGTRCRVEEADWSRTAGGDLRFLVVADRFLHRMVRYLVAAMMDVAGGRRSLDELASMLDGDTTHRPPEPAPACGLYLSGVRYDAWNRPPGIPGFPAA